MITQKKYSALPGLTGCALSLLLIVSFFIPRIWADNTTAESFNTVLIIVILCIAIHLVRKTSALFFEHVWHNIGFTVLIMIPIFNIVVAACQFVWGNIALMQTPLFTAFMVMFSLPAFCCYYFTVIWLFCKRDRRLMTGATILDAVGLIYCLIRLADRVFLPLAVNAGKEITDFVSQMFSFSPWFSLAMYVLAFVSFIVCAKIFSESASNK